MPRLPPLNHHTVAAMFPNMPKKTCSTCKVPKLVALFFHDLQSADGWDSLCMNCRQGRNKEANRRLKPRPSGERPFAASIKRKRVAK